MGFPLSEINYYPTSDNLIQQKHPKLITCPPPYNSVHHLKKVYCVRWRYLVCWLVCCVITSQQNHANFC